MHRARPDAMLHRTLMPCWQRAYKLPKRHLAARREVTGDPGEKQDMRRIIGFVYGVTCYAIFFVTFLYLIAFLANFMVPKGIDGGVPTAAGAAALIDLGLIALFGMQHSIMARPAFKKRLTAFLPESV